MEKKERIKKIVGILLIIAIILFILDNFSIIPLDLSLFSSEKDVKAGNLNMNGVEDGSVKRLKTSLVSFSRSFDGESMEIEIKNVDDTPGEVTIKLKCLDASNEKSITHIIKPSESEKFYFTDLKGDCNDYEIIPEELKP